MAGENQRRRSIGARHRRDKSTGGLLGIGRADDIEVRNDPQAAHGFHRLVGRTILADTDRVVRENVSHRQTRQRRKADRPAKVIGKHQEGRATRAEQSVVSNAIANRAHRMLANAKPNVATQGILGGKITTVLDVIFGGTKKVRTAGDHLRHGLGHGIEHGAARRTRRILVVRREGRDFRTQISRHRHR